MFSLNVVSLSLCTFFVVAAANLGPAPVDLGSTASFAILAETGVSTVPQSSITGDVGLSPFSANNFTGFSLTLDSSGTFATSSQVTGQLLAASYTAPTPAMLSSATSDMQAAYNDASSRANPDFNDLGGGAIGGLVLAPGLYKWTSGVSVAPADVVTISGTSSDIFIFQIGGTLNFTSQSRVVLAGGALASNVIWAVAGVATVNSGAHVEGVILAQASVALLTGATMNGQILAQNFVALQSATLNGDSPPGTISSGPTPIALGTAANFTILAQSGVSTVPQSSITGDVGVSPIAATALTGFNLILDASGTFATSSQVTGQLFAASYTAPTPATLTVAVSDMQTAFTNANNAIPDFTEFAGGLIGGLVLTPGVYKWTTDVLINSEGVTITGTPLDTFIFQIAGTFNIAANASITLVGGALASNIIWAVASDVTANAMAHIEGIILAQTAVTLQTGATMNGRILSQTSVALQSATVVG
ncbi:hypothetical protein BDP27DRAFT_1251938 [Rhodocollybia butyracea]|uniref:Ice-binding protein n=1 Tax=Rhodocollybia butyracea TaxID=206335 RepID=A0A9P5QAZ0_9AGAR|nr:hypothetical protein BDP27DRAFT_1251938 [Rhodocollybia butyracea]